MSSKLAISSQRASLTLRVQEALGVLGVPVKSSLARLDGVASLPFSSELRMLKKKYSFTLVN